MAKTKFDTNPILLRTLLENCASGKLQLPDFQRSWVWEDARIMSLIASVSRGFPMGTLMSLRSNSGANVFAKRVIQGTPIEAAKAQPEQLLLDGQQRMTSLYQSCMRRDVVSTINAKKRLVNRWFYIDMKKALKSEEERELAIFAVPGDRKLKDNFNKNTLLDLSSPEQEYKEMMYPLNRAFDWDEWQEAFGDYWLAKDESEKREVFKKFKNEVLMNFTEYQVPVIALGADTSLEAVCRVFERVNTGGKALDAFELLTAMYAAKGHKLRNDWLGVDQKGVPNDFNWLDTKVADDSRLQSGLQKYLATYGLAANQESGVLANVASTDFLQAIVLLHTKELRLKAMAEKPNNPNEWPSVRATRQSLLDLPLAAYKKYCAQVRCGFERAAKFLYEQKIYRVIDIPYQTQLIPLAAIFADIGGKAADNASNSKKIARWYWCGVFGELYGSTTESRAAKDVMEVPAWIDGGAEPSTIVDGVLRPERLLSMRSRVSAAYKGLNALLMREGACDFRSGKPFDQTVFFDEEVDIHHIFPKAWCVLNKHPPARYDSVVNKTPLTGLTNRIIGGVAPSRYLDKLEKGKKGDPGIEKSDIAEYLKTHCIPVSELYADDFDGFIQARQKLLLAVVCSVTGQAVPTTTDISEEGEEGEDMPSDIARDSGAELAETD